MKSITKLFGLFLTGSLFFACSEKTPVEELEDTKSWKGLVVEMENRTIDGEDLTRATSDFVVNTANDPTLDATRITGGLGWTLDVTVYDKDDTPYAPATANWSYSGTYWVPDHEIYLPSYVKPHVDAVMSAPAPDWNGTIAADQSTANKLLSQDRLEQNGSAYTMTPAHMVKITMRHRYSMLDFILSGVDLDDITPGSVKVIIGSNEYTPYQVGSTGEFLLIMPLGKSNPKVTLTTLSGTPYSAEINISSTVRNTCYCVKLRGLELLLSSVTVIDWTTGEALAGQYTAPSTYPTFRGTPNQTVTLYYDNGLSQAITFNARGEVTEKPLGRTIIQIDSQVLTPPVILDQMYIDLRPYM